MLSCLPFDSSPKELNIVQLTMEFWIKEHFMTSIFDYRFQKRSLIQKIRLILKNPKRTTAFTLRASIKDSKFSFLFSFWFIILALLFRLSILLFQTRPPKTPLLQNSHHSFWFANEIWRYWL